jgi:hypothetical protein
LPVSSGSAQAARPLQATARFSATPIKSSERLIDAIFNDRSAELLSA